MRQGGDMEILEVGRADRARVDEVVEAHMRSFPGFFLTFLGRGFLRQLYRGFAEHGSSGLLAAADESGVAGFLAYSADMGGLYRHLLRRRLVPFAWHALLGLLRRPGALFRLVRALGYPGGARREEPYVGLSSIGVLPERGGSGIGTMLVDRLKGIAADSPAAYIRLETDAEGNEGANGFYQRNGFVLHHAYVTPEGRRMNEYRYYLGNREPGGGAHT